MDSTHGTAKNSFVVRVRSYIWILGTLTLLGTAISLLILLGIGNWLVREDPLQQATAIAVLSGNIPTRALEAAQLYHQGYAKEVWLTHPGIHSDALKAFGIAYPSEDDFNVRVLRRQGVPARAIHVLDTPIVNTAEELSVISGALEKKGGERVIVVTNKAHTRRVHILWMKYFGTRGELIAHGVSDDNFAAARWWRNSGDLTQVTHELLGILNAWAGMPVQPGPRPAGDVVASGSGAREPPSTD
jgi:uncharacterized SAM-binding protein YcdF (DUF218 family)